MSDKFVNKADASTAAGTSDAGPAASAEARIVQFLSLDSDSSRTERLALAFVRFLRHLAPSVLLLLGDFAGLIAAGQMAIWLRHVAAPAEFNVHFYPALLTYSSLMLLTYLAVGLYGPVARSSPDELRRLSLTTTTVALVMAIVTYVSRSRWDIGVFVYIIAWGLALFTVPLCRAVVRATCARRRWWARKAIVLGRNMETACHVVEALKDEPRLGLRPTAVLTTEVNTNSIVPGLPQLHGAGPALAHARAHGIDYAIVATSDLNDPDTLDVIRRYEAFFSHWLIVPYSAHNYSLWVRSRDLNGLLGLELTHRLLKRTDQAAKRIMDIILTLTSGIIALPLCLLIAIAIKIDSPGPILFRQTRLGKDGRAFPAFKFRSMVKNADQILSQYLEEHAELKEEWTKTQKLKNDPRITRVGKFLRKTSLDELPQLLNVCRGEMSLVGPRPCIPEQAQYYDWVWELYIRARPGITGQWQISGRNSLSFKERTTLDAYYIRNWSVWLDLYILARTVLVVLSRDGAY